MFWSLGPGICENVSSCPSCLSPLGPGSVCDLTDSSGALHARPHSSAVSRRLTDGYGWERNCCGWCRKSGVIGLKGEGHPVVVMTINNWPLIKLLLLMDLLQPGMFYKQSCCWLTDSLDDDLPPLSLKQSHGNIVCKWPLFCPLPKINLAGD